MENYPNIKWSLFAAYNDNVTDDFEDMCRRLFFVFYLKGKKIPHSNHNNKGIEVQPIEEAPRDDGKPPRRISFQAKYTNTPSSAYVKFQKSAKETATEYKGKLDLVYLFCNKTLTTDSKQYQKIVKIHKEAGIEVEPVSDRELLDMVAKYPDIANYYFRPRYVADASKSAVLPASQSIVIQSTIGTINVAVDGVHITPPSAQLLKELIKEKVNTCRRYVCDMELDALRYELETLFSYDIDNVECVDKLYYFKFLLELHDSMNSREENGGDNHNNLLSTYIDKCPDRKDVEWIVDFYESPHGLRKDEFLSRDPAIQIYAADKMFTAQLWDELVLLYDETKGEIDHSISKQFELYYGLSLFNLQDNKKAKDILYALYERYHEDRFWFYAVCADIKIHNSIYQHGHVGNVKEFIALFDKLDSFKGLKQYKQQELMVASLCMEASYHIGVFYDSSYLIKAIDSYLDYSDGVKNNSVVKFYYALCLEMNDDRSRAIEVYATLDWKRESAFAERYILCYILNDQADKAIEIINSLSDRNARIDAVYLFALDRSGATSYEDELRCVVQSCKDNLEGIIYISYFIDNVELYKDIVGPILAKLIKKQDADTLKHEQVIQLAILLAHFGEVELLETVLTLIDNPGALNDFAINEIYKAISIVANREYLKTDELHTRPDDFMAAERIADLMLDSIGKVGDEEHTLESKATDSRKAKFLNVKMLCAGAEKLPYSSLKYLKQLFAITENENIACNIVALLVDTKEIDPESYNPYLTVLEQSDNPDHSIVAANAMLFLGREDNADYYAYKALYLLNGEDNYDVFRNYFNFSNRNMRWLRQENQFHIVKNGTVVTLSEINPDEITENHVICLDSEIDFSDADNHSMDIEHLTSTSTEYTKLYGSGLNQIRYFRGKRYKITQIVPRTQYGLKYVLRKVQEKPEMFNGVITMISTKDVEEMIGQIRELNASHTEHVKSLLDSYNFKDNDIGLPVDSLSSGDYDKYIDSFRYLLYQKDEAFYAGQPVYEDEVDQRYVMTLSTLMLLSILDRFDVLDGIKNDIIIPESYIVFIKERYNHSYAIDPKMRSTLFFVDNKPVLQEMDKTIPDIWERMLNYCNSCRVMSVSNDERISLEISDGFTGENLMIGLRLNSIHLDSLVLADREGATYLCDDLFFRKVATSMGIRNINTVSVARHFDDIDYVASFMMDLSKTNYIYIPLLAKDDEQAQEMYDNLMDGVKKREYYTLIINRMAAVRERLLRELYGDDYVDALTSVESSTQ